MLLPAAVSKHLAELKLQGFEVPWTCGTCEHANTTSFGNCEMCKSVNEKFLVAVGSLQEKEQYMCEDDDHLLLQLARTKGAREIEACFNFSKALEYESEGQIQAGVCHYKRAFRLWPELDSALHTDGIPVALRAEADALTRPIDDSNAWALATTCWPALLALHVPVAGSVASVQTKCIQRLWSGLGSIVRIRIVSTMGSDCHFITKVINPPDCLTDFEVRRDFESYHVEKSFYELQHAKMLHNSGAACPQLLYTESGQLGNMSICMTELRGASCRRFNYAQTCAALSWIARLHALYWGREAADAAVQNGLHAQGCYWNLDARQNEHQSMPVDGLKGRLRLAASGLDARLKADRLQTICHGDAKGQNMFFDDEGNVSFLDFQWVGKAPAAKDIVYCLACGRADHLTPELEDMYLQHYYAELSCNLRVKGMEPPLFKNLVDSYELAMCDLARWMAGSGWWGNMRTLQDHAEACLFKVDRGNALASATAYHEALFNEFPP